MTTEKSREQFEAWFAEYVKDWPQPSEAIQKIASDLYWSVWQASRAAMVVELPEPYAVIGDYAACGGGRAVWDVDFAEKITDRMCHKTPVYDMASLLAAGLKVKP